MKITLVNPPSPFLLSDKVFPPLGILYVASTIRRELPGVDIEVADFSGGATPEIDGDIVCVTVGVTVKVAVGVTVGVIVCVTVCVIV